MAKKIIEHNGQKYVIIGDKAIPCDENGVVTGVWSEETRNANGGQDCTVHVPCLQIAAKQQSS